MAYLGYKRKALRKHQEHMEEVRKWKEAEKIRVRKAKQRKNLLMAIAAHAFIAIVLIAIYCLL